MTNSNQSQFQRFLSLLDKIRPNFYCKYTGNIIQVIEKKARDGLEPTGEDICKLLLHLLKGHVKTLWGHTITVHEPFSRRVHELHGIHGTKRSHYITGRMAITKEGDEIGVDDFGRPFANVGFIGDTLCHALPKDFLPKPTQK